MNTINRTIIEVANTHGGSYDYMMSLIAEFEKIGPSGIKFQPFKYDQIAIKDYEWYKVYVKLFFSHDEWTNIIKIASQTKDVWLDLFDTYGVEILEKNLSSVIGIKLQTSVLNNQDVLNALKEIDLSDKKIIINIAGREIHEIKTYIDYFEINLITEELLIEVGFQSYPTELVDSGISKIKFLKSKFGKRIVFADHIDGKDPDARTLPILALLMGADIIEKHVMHTNLPTEYDHFSSIKANEFAQLISDLNVYSELENQDFINVNEKNYLNKTLQVPILSKNFGKNHILSLNDFEFKRTNETGMNYNDLLSKFSSGNNQLKSAKNKHDTIQKTDLKKVKIACIIAARLKSSRLKQKAKLKIGELSSVELCIKNCLKFDHVDCTILATSNVKEDDELQNYTYSPEVIFHQGHPDDVIQRYLDIIRKENIDVFIRVTGDMPYVSKEITSILLKEHFKSGADYTVGEKAAVGTNVEIINSCALERVKKHFPSANYSEYMTWYFQNNPEHFNINKVKLPKTLIRDYRLTIDYQEDLDMFNKIEDYFELNNIEFTTGELFQFLDSNPEIANINAHITLTYRTDQDLIDTLNRETKIK